MSRERPVARTRTFRASLVRILTNYAFQVSVLVVVLFAGSFLYIHTMTKADLVRQAAEKAAYSARIADDAVNGFTRIDRGTSDVAIYLDNRNGCEWLAMKGGVLTPRTAPDAEGVSRHVCNPERSGQGAGSAGI
ncbi:hypothetical protein [Brevundimonas nasdae]|uniref:Histidine kinase n=1 Tax=Brevundimonas nasdae TaxID=172043 RepID=A0ABX8TME0_9CAUL|nr:hypothetical protein [Brevundimonas nasdae]QYC12397.1 hypothetical protein KWG56_18310 [Brevundimonas nasdae]